MLEPLWNVSASTMPSDLNRELTSGRGNQEATPVPMPGLVEKRPRRILHAINDKYGNKLA